MTRNADGTITFKNRAATGGVGLNGLRPGAATVSPNSLGSQNSVVISTDKTQLFAANGSLTLLNARAAFEPGVLTGVNSVSGDSWISPDGKFLYADYFGIDKVIACSIGADGAITKLNDVVIGTSTKLSLQGLTGI